MRQTLDKLMPALVPLWDRLVAWASNLNRASLAWGGLGLAAVILLSVNLIASTAFRSWKGDLTQDRLFTISQGTRQILRSIEEPIQARVYFSKKLGQVAPEYQLYFERVRALLEQYRDISGGKFDLSFIDPEAFSDEEDRAVASGLKGLQLSSDGQAGYFGMAATNATDTAQVIPLFQPEREGFLEYDVSKLIYALANPKKRVVGLITALPIDGGMSPANMMAGQESKPTPPWLIMSQIREFFDVKIIDQGAAKIPDGIDILMVAHPVGLKPQTAYAIDQFALKGGKVLMFIDPVAEAAQLAIISQGTSGRAELIKILASWGITFDPTKVAADIKNARRVQFSGQDGKPMMTEFVAWLGLGKDNIEAGDVLANGVEVLNIASAGILSKADGAKTTVTPLIKTSTDAMLVDSKQVGFGANPMELLRNYKPEGKAFSLAVRVSGETTSAFPAGSPEAEAAKPEAKKDADGKDKKAADSADATPAPTPAPTKKDPLAGHVANGTINAIVIADSDMLADRFWVDARSRQAQQGEAITQTANNAAFVVGALENLSGNSDLIALRARGVRQRPFTTVQELRRDAEKQYREKEDGLTKKLSSLQQELTKLQASGEGGKAALTETERLAVDKFKSDMLTTRRDLRSVKLALRQDIDRLDAWLKFANIAAVPLSLGLGGLGLSLWRSRRKSPG